MKSSYLREFSAQESQIVFLVDLTVLRTYSNCMRTKLSENLIFPRASVQKSQKKRVLSLI